MPPLIVLIFNGVELTKGDGLFVNRRCVDAWTLSGLIH